MGKNGEAIIRNPPGYEIDLDLLRAFEWGLIPRHPERSTIPARVLGSGEITTVFAMDVGGLRGLAFKRLPIFNAPREMVAYRAIHEEYNRLLEAEVGLRVAPYGYAAFTSNTGRPLFYIIQEQQPDLAVAHKALHVLPRADSAALFRQLLRELRKVWDYNARQDRVQVAIDGQISNWAIADFDPQRLALAADISLIYIDTSTPLFRVAGEEQLDPELFLRSAPSFLRWVLRWLFLEDVITRYYDLRAVVIDAIANLYKEQQPDLIPDFIRVANDFFTGEGADLGVEPLEAAEIEAYYKEDALIWTVYLAMRKLDRFLHTRLLRREYPYILPEKIER